MFFIFPMVYERDKKTVIDDILAFEEIGIMLELVDKILFDAWVDFETLFKVYKVEIFKSRVDNGFRFSAIIVIIQCSSVMFGPFQIIFPDNKLIINKTQISHHEYVVSFSGIFKKDVKQSIDSVDHTQRVLIEMFLIVVDYIVEDLQII